MPAGNTREYISRSFQNISKINSRMLSSSSGRHLLTKTYSYGCTNVIDFSKLSARQAADLEDALIYSLNNNGLDDTKLVDPVLGKTVTQKGLNWIKSISIPSPVSFGDCGSSIDAAKKSLVLNVCPPTLLHPQLHELSANLAQAVQEKVALSNGSDMLRTLDPKEIPVEIRIQPQSTRQQTKPNLKTSQSTLPTLQNIKHFLAVYSCKGGVGKSTIAVNLAYQLASMGGRVGLLDLDVYGPSLPLLVKPDDPAVRKSPPDMGEGIIEPIEHRGVKLMSLGYVSPNSGVPGSGQNGGAAVLRGPMAGRVVSQLLKGTNWGELDVLVLDMPPGTGDIQLEVCQSLSLSGAVAVSTPSALAWADVVKGVQMFGEMGVMTLALVENMSYFVCEGGGRHYPFGKSQSPTDESMASKLSQFMPNQSHTFHLPISTTLNTMNDSGTPLCADKPTDTEDELAAFSQLANAISVDLLRIQHGLPPLSVESTISNGKSIFALVIEESGELEFDVPLTQLSVDNEARHFTVRLFGNEGGYQKTIHGFDLRCRDPKTGDIDESLLANIQVIGKSQCGGGNNSNQRSKTMVQHHSACDHGKEEDGLFPATLTRKGNYGYEVLWADGAKIIYSLLAISKAAGGNAK
jgi:Mrp family chromosome partitioning ATPase